jgi:drug/metabolite transporter (DMT)-like permease
VYAVAGRESEGPGELSAAPRRALHDAAMIAILGGLGAAAGWALSTLCSSRSSKLVDPRVVVAWVMLVGLVIAGPAAAISGVPRALHGASVWWLALAGVGNVAGLAFSYQALRIGQVALVAPLVSTEGAIAAVISIVAGETLAPSVGVALLVIALGIGLASVPGVHAAEETRARHPESVVLAALAALAFGAGLYATGRAGATLPSSWVVVSARAVGVAAVALPLALRGGLKLPRPAVKLVVTSGVCEVLGFYSYTVGSRHGIAIAAVMSSQFAVLTVIGAYLVFRERLSRVQVCGVCGVLIGVAALSVLRA